MINASTGQQVDDHRSGGYTGLGTVYQYGHQLPYGPYTGLPKAPGAPGAASGGGGSSTSTSTTGPTGQAQTFLNGVLSGDKLPFSPAVRTGMLSQQSDMNAAAESALTGRMDANAAVGGAGANDPSLQGGKLGAMAKRQTANSTAKRDIDTQAEGANFDAQLRAASMLEESRRQSEALAAGVQKTAMGYMPWNQQGGGSGGGVNNFNLPQQQQSQSSYNRAQSQAEYEQDLQNAREDNAYRYGNSGSNRTPGIMRPASHPDSYYEEMGLY